MLVVIFFFFQAEDGIRDYKVTGVQTCALPISEHKGAVVPEEPEAGRRSAGRAGAWTVKPGRFAAERVAHAVNRPDEPRFPRIVAKRAANLRNQHVEVR